MTDRPDFRELDADHFAECAAWIRAAGDYLEVSEDLRPATLESARAVAYERRVGGSMLIAAVLAFLLTLPITSERPSLRGSTAFGVSTAAEYATDRLQLGFASSQDLFRFVGSRNARAGAETGGGLESGWTWVEAFQQVHRQRSAALGGG